MEQKAINRNTKAKLIKKNKHIRVAKNYTKRKQVKAGKRRAGPHTIALWKTTQAG